MYNKDHILIFTEGIKLPDNRLPVLDSLHWDDKQLPISMSYNWDIKSILGHARNVRREGAEIFADLNLLENFDLTMFNVNIYATHLVGTKDSVLNITYITDMVLRGVTLIPMLGNPGRI